MGMLPAARSEALCRSNVRRLPGEPSDIAAIVPGNHTAALWSAPAARCSAISYQQRNLFGYDLNGGNATRASPGLHAVAEKGAFGLRTECSLQSAKNSETKSLRISQHKWIFPPNLRENHDVGPHLDSSENREEWQ